MATFSITHSKVCKGVEVPLFDLSPKFAFHKPLACILVCI